MLRSAKELLGYAIAADDEGEIGKIHDLYFDAAEWAARYFVVDVGSWLFGRRVLLTPDAVTAADWGNQRLLVNLTKQQVKDSPDVDFAKPIPRQYEAALYEHYGWPVYWGNAQLPYVVGAGMGAGIAPIAPPMLEPTAEANMPSEVVVAMEQADDPHLYNVRDVTGYPVEAQDGTIGHVADFLLDDETWDIHYLVVDTGHWLPGKQVLVAPTWIDNSDWVGAHVHANVTQDQVKNSPAYDPNVPLDRRYESELHAHYGYPAYWEQDGNTPTISRS